jgi:hypothetical protein
MITSLTSVSQLSKICGILDVSQSTELPWPVTEMASLLLVLASVCHQVIEGYLILDDRIIVEYAAGSGVTLRLGKPKDSENPVLVLLCLPHVPHELMLN